MVTNKSLGFSVVASAVLVALYLLPSLIVIKSTFNFFSRTLEDIR